MTQILSFSQPSSSFIEQFPIAYSEVDAQGIIRVVNPAACRLRRMAAEELIGHAIWEFVPADEAAQDRAGFFRDLESEGHLPAVFRSLLVAGEGYRTHQLHRCVLRDPHGKPTGIAAITLDVSESESRLRESRQQKLWLESALAAIPQAVIVTDALGQVRYCNRAAEQLTGRSSEELAGMQFERGIPVLRTTSRSSKSLSFQETLYEPWHGDIDLLTRRGQTVSVWLSASPILDHETGSTSGVVIVLGSPKAAVK